MVNGLCAIVFNGLCSALKYLGNLFLMYLVKYEFIFGVYNAFKMKYLLFMYVLNCDIFNKA